jgi:hypothetical protein
MTKVHEEGLTAGQVDELIGFARRLSKREYQERRNLLRRATDPDQDLGSKLLWSFKDERPLDWGWIVEREGALCESCVDISRLELIPFHKYDENWVGGEEMLRRANDTEAFPGCQGWSQHYAEDILERANELPEDFRKFVIVFADSVFLDEDGDRRVPYLVWYGSRWCLDWDFLDYSFRRDDRFLRLRK